jgi:hypothetical protein
MLQPGDGVGFAAKAFADFEGEVRSRGDHLELHQSVEAPLPGAIHDSDAAAANLLENVETVHLGFGTGVLAFEPTKKRIHLDRGVRKRGAEERRLQLRHREAGFVAGQSVQDLLAHCAIVDMSQNGRQLRLIRFLAHQPFEVLDRRTVGRVGSPLLRLQARQLFAEHALHLAARHEHGRDFHSEPFSSEAAVRFARLEPY